jgi:hypothetical protein
MDWLQLKDLKYSNLIEADEYAISNEIYAEPVFAWLVQHTLHRHDHFIKKVKTRYWKKLTNLDLNFPNQSKKFLLLTIKWGLQSGEMPLLKR